MVKKLRHYERPDGTIMHAEVQLDDSVIMLSEATRAYPAVPMVMHVYVPDVDKTFERAVSAGCDIIEPPHQQDDESDKRGTFKDFAGNIWSVATQMPSVNE